MNEQLSFERRYKTVLDILIKFGWIVTPYLIGKDFNKVESLVAEINGMTSNDEHTISERINSVLSSIISHPQYRAFFVYRSKELKYVQNFSHHIERAILHYYKSDYLSSVLCLLPAIEGSLLAYYGWNFGVVRKPSIEKLIREIEKCRVSTQDSQFYKIYSEIISVFLKKWIFQDTTTSDMSFSFLNRHYALHGMGTNIYYSLADVNRLIMFFDIFIEFLSIEEKKYYTFIPEKNKSIDDLREYYFKLLNENIAKNEVLKQESEFMLENLYNHETETNSSNSYDALFQRLIKNPEIFTALQNAIQNISAENK